MKKMFKTIKTLLLLIFTLTLFSGCFFVSKDLKVNNLPSYTDQNSFKWGIGFDPYPNGVHREDNFNTVVKKDQELGVKWLRIMVPDWDMASLTYTTNAVERCSKEGFNVIVGFQPEQSYDSYDDPYKNGFDLAHKVASQLSNINYFQLSNEPAAGAIKETWSGVDEESFDQEKYQKVAAWLKGASDGVKDVNPKAKKVITGHWLHVGFFDLLDKDKLGYDIIGWDWHQQSPDLTKIEDQGQVYNLLDLLKKFKKEVWITEAGIYGGSQNGEQAQADYLKQLANQTYDSGVVKGFFIFTLYDGIPKQEQNENNLGIMELNQDQSGAWILGEPKTAYYEMQNIIKKMP